MFTKFLNHNSCGPHLIDNAPFGGAIVPVETRDPAVEIIERVQPSLSQRLLNLRIDDANVRKQRQELVAALGALTLQAEEFLSEFAERRNAELDEQLEKIRAEGRQHLEVVEQLQIAHERAVTNLRNLREESENLGAQVKDLRRAPISRWASKAERTARQKKIDRLQEQLRESVNEVAAAGRAQQEAWQELTEARERMTEISNSERRISGQLSGKPFVGEYGLVESPTI